MSKTRVLGFNSQFQFVIPSEFIKTFIEKSCLPIWTSTYLDLSLILVGKCSDQRCSPQEGNMCKSPRNDSAEPQFATLAWPCPGHCKHLYSEPAGQDQPSSPGAFEPCAYTAAYFLEAFYCRGWGNPFDSSPRHRQVNPPQSGLAGRPLYEITYIGVE